MGGHAVCAPQVPLADVRRVIALLGQQFSQRDLRGRHAHLIVAEAGRLSVHHHGRPKRPIAHATNHADNGHEAGGRRREFETKAGAVAPRHQCRPRGCAGPVGGVPPGEVHPLRRQRIDVGSLSGRVRAVHGHIVPSQVIGQYQHDVGQAIGRITPFTIRASGPVDFLGRTNIVLRGHHATDAEQGNFRSEDPAGPQQHDQRQRNSRDPLHSHDRLPLLPRFAQG